MTAPVQPDQQAQPDPSTLPFNPADLWEKLHAQGGTADEVTRQVQEHIRRAQFGLTPEAQDAPGKLASALMGFGQGASFGFSDEIAGLLDPGVLKAAATGDMGQIRQAISDAIGQNRDYLARARAAHGTITNIAQLVGTGAGSALLGAGMGPLTEGMTAAQAGGSLGAATGALQGAGMASGGADTRALAALGGGVTGAALGAGIGKFVGPTATKLWQNVVQRTKNTKSADLAMDWFLAKAKTAPERPVPQTVVDNLSKIAVSLDKTPVDAREAAARAFLTKTKYGTPAQIEEALSRARSQGYFGDLQSPGTGLPPTPQGAKIVQEVQAQAAQRGESLQQIAPKGFAVEGTRATPAAPSGPSLAELTGGPGSPFRQTATEAAATQGARTTAADADQMARQTYESLVARGASKADAKAAAARVAAAIRGGGPGRP